MQVSAEDYQRTCRALEVALRNEREMCDTLTKAQADNTQLLERARDADRRMKSTRDRLYELKFQVDQGADALQIDRFISAMLDGLRDP